MFYLIRNPELRESFLAWSEEQGGYFWTSFNNVKAVRENNTTQHPFIFMKYKDIKMHQDKLREFCDNYIIYVVEADWNHVISYESYSEQEVSTEEVS